MAIDLEKFDLVNRIVEAVYQGVFKSHEIEHFRTWEYYAIAEAELQSINKSEQVAEEVMKPK
jgi:hypothetical protein